MCIDVAPASKEAVGAPEIEVTPPMVRAGAMRFCLADVHILNITDRAEEIVSDIFKEMEIVRITGNPSPEIKRLYDV